MKHRRFVIPVLLAVVCLCAGCGKSNHPAAIGGSGREIPAPMFSHETGAYDEKFTLTVVGGAGTTLRYTLDGSLPTAESPEFPAEGMVITDRSGEPNVLAAVDTNKISLETDHVPPAVTKGTVIRAAAFSSDGEKMSEVTTETYLVGLAYKDIKIVSLVLDSGSLFDYETGIYVMGKYYDDWMASDPEARNAASWEIKGNFSQKGREWEREVLFQLMENEQFRARFIDTFMDLRNTCFRPEDALETLDEMQCTIAPYIAEQKPEITIRLTEDIELTANFEKK